MNEPVTIDPEFQSLIPPLSDEEFRQLEENCKRDGILDSLKVWHGILIDGHNRYRISEKWDLNYRIEEIEFRDRQAAIHWIILNQFGRRNLPAYERARLALRLKPIIAEQAKERKTLGLKSDEGGRTDETLGKLAGVGKDTIHKVETIEAKASELLKEQVKAGQKTINQAWLEIKEKERKQTDIGTRARLNEAEERHEEFKASKTVSMEEAMQDKKDLAVIAGAKAREIQNSLKKILFFGAAMSGGDMDFSEIKKYLSEYDLKLLKSNLDNAAAILSKIRGCL